MTLAEFRTQVKLKIQDKAVILSDTDIGAIIIAALQQFSKDCPREQTGDIAGDGSYEYDLPVDWQPGFSVIKKVEYPAGRQEPAYLEDSDWLIYETPAEQKLRLLTYTPVTGETIRVTYTALYLESGIGDIPAHEQDAFGNLAAADCCHALARYYSQTSDIGINVDSVNYREKSNIYAQRAKELYQRYKEFAGRQTKDGTMAASAIKDWDVDYPWGGDRLTHPKRQR